MSSTEIDRERWLRVAPRQPWAWQIGELEALSVPSPAVGADWSYTPDGQFWEQIEWARARLVAAAVAVTRTPTLTVKDQKGLVLYEQPVLAGQTTGQTIDYTFARELASTFPALGGKVTLPVGRIILRPQWTLSVVTGLIDAGDQWSQIALLVRRFVNADPPNVAG